MSWKLPITPIQVSEQRLVSLLLAWAILPFVLILFRRLFSGEMQRNIYSTLVFGLPFILLLVATTIPIETPGVGDAAFSYLLYPGAVLTITSLLSIMYGRRCLSEHRIFLLWLLPQCLYLVAVVLAIAVVLTNWHM